jgi:site-specific recombinase XerD
MRRGAPRRVIGPARKALFAWSYALKALGRPVPEWQPMPAPPIILPLLSEYADYRKRLRGVAEGTVKRDLSTAGEFLATLRHGGRAVTRVRVRDIDDFVTRLSSRCCPRTVADTCSSLRAFLRFLHATGRLHRDLAAVVTAPRVRRVDRPPRALAWKEVRRLVRAAHGEGPVARRDYAMLLLMATYGLGAAEVAGLRLDDIDWSAAVMRVRRPKTAMVITLPLLPAIGKAVAAYLRSGRPARVTTRSLFVSSHMPHRTMSTGAIRNVVRQHARNAGICVPVGGHTLRHSLATRQIDSGANVKVVGDLLGHRRPASTSVYIRVARKRLRGVGLPVPV